MDISTIYVAEAVKALSTPAIRERIMDSSLAAVTASLSTISDALDNGHEFSEDVEVVPVENPTPGTRSLFAVQIVRGPSGLFKMNVPDPYWGGSIELIAAVNDRRKVWQIQHLELLGRSLDDR